MLVQKGFMVTDREGNLKMKNIRDLMDSSVAEIDVPQNLLHLF